VKITLALLLMFVPLAARAATGGSGNCITPREVRLAETAIRANARPIRSATAAVLYTDPVGGGGTQSLGKTINNYVDLDPSGAALDPYCGAITYDGHTGHDILIPSFFDMDEGVPILCAAPGTVVYSHDGEPDRWAARDASHVANAVIVQNDADGSFAHYWHMRTGSVRVVPSQVVAVGDTLGMIGSSGDSNWPHLHFETQFGGTIEPDNGPCQSNPTWWAVQKPYTMDMPFECYNSGITLMPLDQATVLEKPPSKTHVKYPALIQGWFQARAIKNADTYTWNWYRNGVASGSNTVQYAQAGTSYEIQTKNIVNSSGSAGNWRLDILRNGTIFAQLFWKIDNIANQLPTIAPQTIDLFQNQALDGVFAGTDPDGSIFWYVVDSGPTHGTLVQSGGRKRKFRYTPNPGYVGLDTVVVHALDDENAAGAMSQYTFDVHGASGVPEAIATHGAGVQLYAPAPNPMSRGGELSYRLATAGRVRLALHDVSGRVIRVLDDGERGAGNHRVSWDGRDGDGRPVSAGVYFARLSAGGAWDARRVALLP
jgi:murein DD-endopeptidase MepM/ murein hydrolase activator NlpD